MNNIWRAFLTTDAWTLQLSVIYLRPWKKPKRGKERFAGEVLWRRLNYVTSMVAFGGISWIPLLPYASSGGTISSRCRINNKGTQKGTYQCSAPTKKKLFSCLSGLSPMKKRSDTSTCYSSVIVKNKRSPNIKRTIIL